MGQRPLRHRRQHRGRLTGGPLQRTGQDPTAPAPHNTSRTQSPLKKRKESREESLLLRPGPAMEQACSLGLHMAPLRQRSTKTIAPSHRKSSHRRLPMRPQPPRRRTHRLPLAQTHRPQIPPATTTISLGGPRPEDIHKGRGRGPLRGNRGIFQLFI